VGIVVAMAADARGGEPEIRGGKAAVLGRRLPHGRVHHVLRAVTVTAGRARVAARQVESGGVVVEARGVEVHGVKVGAEVVLVALAAVLGTDRGVEALAPRDALGQRLVAVETLGVGDPALPELMAPGAVPHAVEVAVRSDELAGGEQLAVRRRSEGEEHEEREPDRWQARHPAAQNSHV
jgi:hypothetical protein